MKTILRPLLLLGILGVIPMSLAAQQPATLSAARVTLVAGTSPLQGGRTEVIRRAGRSPQNVVIVSTNANADDLAGALALVNALRITYGGASSVDYRARPDFIRHGPTWQDSEYRKWLQDQLVRLRQAREANLGELGWVKAVQITLPPPPSTATTGASSGLR